MPYFRAFSAFSVTATNFMNSITFVMNYLFLISSDFSDFASLSDPQTLPFFFKKVPPWFYLRRRTLYPTELQTHTVYVRRNSAIVFYLLMCDAVKGAFRRRRRAFFRKRRCNRIHRVIFLAYMDESPVKLNRNIRMKEPCVIHGL